MRMSIPTIHPHHHLTPAAATSSPLGPITRARAHQLNHQASSSLSSCPLYLDNGNMCTFVMRRNDGEDKKENGFTWVKLVNGLKI